MSTPTRRYYRRFAIGMTAYSVGVVAFVLAVQALGEQPWRWAAVLLMLPGIVLVIRAIVLYVREADELQAKMVVESLAVGFGGGSLTCFSYGLLQLVGAPAINWMFVWVVYGAWWIVGGAIVRRRYGA